jgi:bifunctional non-homologous end joining protein LigD
MRGGGDWTARMPALTEALRALQLRSAWLDGEIVVEGARGHADFNALQNAFDSRRTQAITYQLFDLPYLEGHDLRDVPLHARRELLRRLLEERGGPLLQFSAELEGDAAQALQRACRAQKEGVMAKRRDSPYRSTRSDSWLKLKCRQRQEFVVGGYTARSDGSAEVGSLLLGVHDAQGHLQPAGRVGTGWSRATGHALYEQLRRMSVKASPFTDRAAGRSRGQRGANGNGAAQWVRPELVAEVQFAEWTPSGQVRQASFVALRSDKPARAVIREVASPPPTGAQRSAVSKPASSRSSSRRRDRHRRPLSDGQAPRRHPSRARDRCGQRADQARPRALLRQRRRLAGAAPEEAAGGVGAGPERHRRHAVLSAPCFEREDRRRAPARSGTVAWPRSPARGAKPRRAAGRGADERDRVPHLELDRREDRSTDRMVFDLDPGEGIAWAKVREAAALVRALLNELGLRSWIKTSGGKGLHVVVPIAPRWPDEW